MKIVDLSHEIQYNMTVYSDDERPIFNDISKIKISGYNEKSINICSHTGTHIDSPYHMIEKGKSLYEIDVENFLGNAFIVDISDNKGDIITLDKLECYKKEIEKIDFLIIKTGWEKYWNKEEYLSNFPILSEEAAKWLAKLEIKGIGVDTISVDSTNSTDFPIHMILFKEGKLIIENLTNLEKVPNKFMFIATPLNFKKADGCPVRAIGLVE